MQIKHVVGILVLLAAGLLPAPAYAAGVVAVCDEAHLLAALAGGGTVTFSCSGVIALSAEITIAADTTIDGAGQTVTISGNHTVRVFKVNPGITLNLNELTVANGAGDHGGGILNSGTVTVNNSTFSGNDATGWSGGGIYNDQGTVIVSNSTFSGNSAVYYGGGIHGGTVTISDSTFSNNSADLNGGGIASGTLTISNSTFSGNSAGGWGGGIIAGAIHITNSTFSGNSADHGGGIYTSCGCTLTISNNTFSGNSAVHYGGGIYHDQGTLVVSNSTFYGNSADHGGGLHSASTGFSIVSNSTFSGNSATDGGGIHKSLFGGVTLKNTIVANSPAGGNCAGPDITDGGGNLSYPDATCPGINLNPYLYPLQDNGGPTATMALGPGSAALDAGDDATCAAAPVNNLDQRGEVRPKGSRCDIGAIEQEPYPKRWLPIAFRR